MKTKEIIEALEVNYPEIELSDLDKKEIKETYKHVSEDYEDLNEFRVFKNLKEAADWSIDNKQQAFDTITYLAEKIMESDSGSYNMDIRDLLDDRYHQLESGKVVVNLEC